MFWIIVYNIVEWQVVLFVTGINQICSQQSEKKT